MVTTTWKQVVYDVADAVRDVNGTEELIPVGELANEVQQLNHGEYIWEKSEKVKLIQKRDKDRKNAEAHPWELKRSILL